MALGVCACCRHRRPSAGPPASAAGSSSVAVPAGSAPSPAPLPCGAAPACAASASLPSASAPPSPAPRSPSASREMCSTRWPSIVRAISVSCRRLARPLSANSEKARENVASLGSRPAPLQPHSRHSLPVNLKTLDQAARRRNVEHGLGYEGARQRRAVLLRPPYLAAEVGQKSLDPHQFQNRDEEARSARPSGQARSRASGTTPVERRTSNPIASRAGTRLHSSVVIHAVFCGST